MIHKYTYMVAMSFECMCIEEKYTCAGSKKMFTNHWLAKANLRSFKYQSRRSVSAVFQNYIAYRRFWQKLKQPTLHSIKALLYPN